MHEIREIDQEIERELRGAPPERQKEINEGRERDVENANKNYYYFRDLLVKTYREFMVFSTDLGIREELLLCDFKLRLIDLNKNTNQERDWTIDGILFKADDE